MPVAEAPAAGEMEIALTISRDGDEVFTGSTQVALLRRGLDELVSWLFRATDFPVGAVLLTGTSVIPAVEFTLRGGDEVRIAITGLGELVNTVEVVGDSCEGHRLAGAERDDRRGAARSARPGPGELILQPEAVGICGSEVEGYLGHMGNRTPPLVMGHEFAGRSSRPARAPRSSRARGSRSIPSAGAATAGCARRGTATCAATGCSSACTCRARSRTS